MDVIILCANNNIKKEVDMGQNYMLKVNGERIISFHDTGEME